MNNTISHLSVLRFRLDKGLGYGYCKILDFRSLDPWYGLVVKVFDFRSQETISDVKVLEHVPNLLQPLTIGWYPTKEDGHGWEVIGQLVHPNDAICPVFKVDKSANQYSSSPAMTFQSKEWCPVYRFHERGPVCQYKQLAHLETLHLGTSDNVVNRATMEFLRKDGKNIEDFYYLENNQYILEDYLRAREMPLYQRIPIRYRNSIIPPQKMGQVRHLPSIALCVAASWAI